MIGRSLPSANKPPSSSKPLHHHQHHPQIQNPQLARHRAYSNPFSDPVLYSKPVPRLPPEPPAKFSQRPKMVPVPVNKQPPRENVVEAVRDTVQLKSSEQPSRARTGRSHTVVSNQPAAPPRTHGRRSMSQDSVLHTANALEKGKSKPRGKKSAHADVIDRLDFSGVGPMFHHDGPFDACAPSRNRHRAKAPMLAWSSPPGDDPLAPSGSPYPSPEAYSGAFSYEPPKKKVDAIAEAWGIHEPEPFEEFFAGGGTARRDGDTPSNSIYAGREGHGSRHATPQHSIGKRSKDGRDLREVYREYLDDGSQVRDKDRSDRDHRRPRRGVLPPPQPVLVPDAHDPLHHSDVETGPGSPTGVPKRTKSLMQRIRRMRESPNVPVSYDSTEQPPSPPLVDQYRPTHRPQNSLLGRFAGGNGVNMDRRGNMKENTSPVVDNFEPYVYIDNPRREKQLPATPTTPVTARTTFAEDRYGEYGASGSPGAGAPLGRKTSLLKKVKDAVRGPR